MKNMKNVKNVLQKMMDSSFPRSTCGPLLVASVFPQNAVPRRCELINLGDLFLLYLQIHHQASLIGNRSTVFEIKGFKGQQQLCF